MKFAEEAIPSPTRRAVQQTQRMHLKYIYTGDFRKNEATLMADVAKEMKHLRLGPNDCILLLSSNKTILRFVFGFIEGEYDNGRGYQRDTKVLPSRTFRIVGSGKWNPFMLGNYAEMLGIELAHIKKFEQHLKDELADA